MPKGLGERQKEIGLCLVGHRDLGVDALELARLIYRVDKPSESQMNVTWAALKGLSGRKLIVHASTNIDGFRRWILTGEGKKVFEALKKERKTGSLKVVK